MAKLILKSSYTVKSYRSYKSFRCGASCAKYLTDSALLCVERQVLVQIVLQLELFS